MQHADIKVSVKGCIVKKCNDFADIFQGKMITGISPPIAPVVANCDLQANTPLYETIAIKRIRFDRTDENKRNNIFSVSISPRIYTVISSIIQTLLALAEHEWSTLNHPNICPTWLLTSSNQLTEAVAIPWFNNGNIVDFMEKNPGNNRYRDTG